MGRVGLQPDLHARKRFHRRILQGLPELRDDRFPRGHVHRGIYGFRNRLCDLSGLRRRHCVSACCRAARQADEAGGGCVVCAAMGDPGVFSDRIHGVVLGGADAISDAAKALAAASDWRCEGRGAGGARRGHLRRRLVVQERVTRLRRRNGGRAHGRNGRARRTCSAPTTPHPLRRTAGSQFPAWVPLALR